MRQSRTRLSAARRRRRAQVFDAAAQLADLAAAPDARAARGKPLQQAPRGAHAHAAEGFALDWSRVAAGRLASGDCAGAIHVWEPTDKGGWLVGGAHRVRPTQGRVLSTGAVTSACTGLCALGGILLERRASLLPSQPSASVVAGWSAGAWESHGRTNNARPVRTRCRDALLRDKVILLMGSALGCSAGPRVAGGKAAVLNPSGRPRLCPPFLHIMS